MQHNRESNELPKIQVLCFFKWMKTCDINAFSPDCVTPQTVVLYAAVQVTVIYPIFVR
jgi:hypothetical protein